MPTCSSMIPVGSVNNASTSSVTRSPSSTGRIQPTSRAPTRIGVPSSSMIQACDSYARNGRPSWLIRISCA